MKQGFNNIGGKKINSKNLSSKLQTADGTVIDKGRGNWVEFSSKVESDTSKKENKVIGFYDNGEQFVFKLELVDFDQEINIIVKNMLGKNVTEVFKGTPQKDYEYSFTNTQLPNGVYLLWVQGHKINKALTKKFIVSR